LKQALLAIDKFDPLRTIWCYLIQSPLLVEQLEMIRAKFKKEYSSSFAFKRREVKIKSVYFALDNPTLETPIIIETTNGKFVYSKGYFKNFQTMKPIQVNSVINELRISIKIVAVISEVFFENMTAFYSRMVNGEKYELYEYDINKLHSFNQCV